MPPGVGGFEPKISAGERPQTYALDRAATWIGKFRTLVRYKFTCRSANLELYSMYIY